MDLCLFVVVIVGGRHKNSGVDIERLESKFDSCVICENSKESIKILCYKKNQSII